jgi:hypothetical protein
VVIGFGEKKTPDAFRRACDEFILNELLRKPETVAPEIKPSSAIAAPRANSIPENTKNFLLDALEQSSDEKGWAHLGAFGKYLKRQPDFDFRVYGYKKLLEFVKAETDLFVTEERKAPGQSQKHPYLRAK